MIVSASTLSANGRRYPILGQALGQVVPLLALGVAGALAITGTGDVTAPAGAISAVGAVSTSGGGGRGVVSWPQNRADAVGVRVVPQAITGIGLVSAPPGAVYAMGWAQPVIVGTGRVMAPRGLVTCEGEQMENLSDEALLALIMAVTE